MQKSILYFILALLLVFGCSLKQSADYLSSMKSASRLTKSIIVEDGFSSYMLSEKDLQNYVVFKELGNKGLHVSKIEPIPFNNITSLYVIQFDDGYEIISADKRSPIPIAFCNSGVFSECNDPEGFNGHLETIAEQVWLSLNGYLGEPSPEAEEYIQKSLDFWKMVNADTTYLAKNAKSIGKEETIGNTRGYDPVPGHWQLIDVINEEIVYDSIPHLTSTTWYQRGAYNYYCPDDRDTAGIITNCPAGCVAIAGAQMLYFLHYKIGVPLTSPACGSCSGHVYDSSYLQCFWNYATSSWGYMHTPRCTTSTDTYAAKLVGDVGKKLLIHYSWDGSSSHIMHLVDRVFPPYGINSTYYNGYSSSIIVSSLSAGYPVVCGGSRLAKTDDKVGHAFLIDGYKRYRTKTTCIYEWVLDAPIIGKGQIKTEVSYSSPHISYYCMNWGQYSTAYNNVWCSLDGIWQYSNNPPYIYDRGMVYNFNCN